MASSFQPPVTPPTDSAPSTSPAITPKTSIAWLHIVTAIGGIAASLWAHHVHTLIKAGMSSGCSISETITCDKVIGSKYGEVFGISLGLYGLLFWAIVIITSINGPQTSPRMAALQRLGVATVGFGSSIVFASIAEFVIGAFCPVCATTHTLTLINFIIAIVGFLKVRKTA